MNYFSTEFPTIETFGSQSLPAVFAVEHGIARHFRYLYGLLANIQSPDTEMWAETTLRRSLRSGIDLFIESSEQDFSALLHDNEISPKDIILLPSADFYGVMGLLRVIDAVRPSRCPKIYFRFIGVSEMTNYISPTPFDELVSAIRRYRSLGYPISISAETPDYARYLADLLLCDVPTIPYPSVVRRQLPLPAGNPFTIFSAGASRLDKGWMRLLPIIARVLHNSDQIDTKFLIQVPPDRELAHHQAYASQLYAAPGVELLPSTISSAEMADFYAQSHAVILPYDKDVYRFRGSAIFMEALGSGRLVFATDGAGFSQQVSQYGAGVLCDSDEDFASAIISTSARTHEDIEKQMLQAQERFISDTDAAYASWIVR